jgi:hypothetical protein
MTVCIVQMPISENTDMLIQMRVEHVACMEEKRNAKSLYVGKPEVKRPY